MSSGDQITYNTNLANAAHSRNLAIGLKNDLEQVGALESLFDFAVNEECMQWDECDVLDTFINNGKAVFHVEYEGYLSDYCPTANAKQFDVR